MTGDLLQLHRGPVYPPSNGEETRIWKTAEKLSERATVWLAHPCDPQRNLPGDIRPIDLENPLLNHKATRIYLWNALLGVGGDNWFERVQTRLTVRHVLNTVPPVEAVFCESPQVLRAGTRIANELNASLVLNKHNAMYQLLDQQLNSRSIPGPIRRRAVDNLRRLEQRGIDAADAVVYQSEDDVRCFSHTSETSVRTIPNGCDFDNINGGGNPVQVSEELGIDRSRTICIFVGAYDYEPNAKAAEVITDRIAPSLPEIEFLLVGRDPPTSTPTNVHAPGYVSDLPGALSLADIALCPLTMGSGTKLKMLDYLAAGLPIVTTPVGAQGLPIEDGKTALVREDLAGIVGGIRELEESDELASRLSINAKKLGRQYSWERLLSDYDELLDELQLPVSPR